MLGKTGESVAATYLEKRGYRILARNQRFKFGELDLVAWKNRILVLVEVKAISERSGKGCLWRPEDGLTRRKQRNLRRAALYYANQTRTRPNGIVGFQIDVIAVTLHGTHARVRHYENALAL